MKYVLSVVALVMGSATVSAVSAADLIVDQPGMVEAATSPFDGFYAGVHAGYGWANTTGEACFYSLGPTCEEPLPIDYNQTGWLLGAQAGANFVMDSGLLMGAEVSGSWANIHGTEDLPNMMLDIDDAGTGYTRTIDALGLAVAKLGFASDTFSLYGMGGLALGHSITDIDLGFATLGYETMHTGWTLGLGAEAMVADRVSVFASYNYISFGEVTGHDSEWIMDTPFAIETTTQMDMHVAKVGLNYHFD